MRKIVIVILIISLFFSCYDLESLKPTQVIYSPSIAVSLIQSKIKMSQFINLKGNEANMYYELLIPELSKNANGYVYKYVIPNIVNDSLNQLSFLNFNLTQQTKINFGVLDIFKNSLINPIPWGQDIALPSFSFPFFEIDAGYIENPKIKKIDVLSGTINVESRSFKPIDGALLVITLKNVKNKFGGEVNFQLNLNKSINNSEIDISGSIIDFSKSDSIIATLVIKKINDEEEFIEIDKTESIEIEFKTSDFKFNYIKGDMGYIERNVPDLTYTIPSIPIKDSSKTSKITFPEIRIQSDINSNLGFPIKIVPVFMVDDKTLNLNNDTIKLKRPSKIGMKTNADSLIIDKTNSNNIVDIFNNKTKQIVVKDAKLYLGQRGIDTSEFLIANSKLNMSLNIRVPLILDIKNVSYIKNINIILDSTITKLEKAILMFKFNNSFSFSSTVNIQFCDSFNNTLFDVKPVNENNEIVKTITPASYSFINKKYVIEPSQSISYYEIPIENIKKIQKVRLLKLDFLIDTDKQSLIIDSINTLDFFVNFIGKYQDTLKFKK